MYEGTRWRMRVADFASVRGASKSMTSKQTAARVWEPKFLAEIAAGRLRSLAGPAARNVIPRKP
jgi:hypothetical protein